MQEREAAVSEFWKRAAATETVVFTARNPKEPPADDNLPAIQFFELEDEVASASRRGGYPAHIRNLTVVAEMFLKAESEGSANKELYDLAAKFKAKIYEGRVNNLGGACAEISEVSAGRVLRPDVGGPVIGMGIVFRIRYIENVALLF